MEKCKICEKDCKDNHALGCHIAWAHKIKSKEYYDTYLRKPGEGVCLVCGKETVYQNMGSGYNKFCSLSCSAKFPEHQDAVKASILEKFGVEHPFQSKEIHAKIQTTFLEKYGETSPAKADTVKKNIVKTNLERYGVAYPLQLEEVQDKVTKTCVEKNGGRGFASDNVSQTVKDTCLEQYGVEYASQSPVVKERVRQTNIKRFGKEYYTQTDEYKKRASNTWLQKYGGIGFASKEMQEKLKQQMLERYGVENPFQAEEVKEKIKRTNLERYGVECVLQREEVQQASHSKQSLEKCFETKRKNRTFNTSKPENEPKARLQELLPDLKTQYKSDAYPFACDFYIPSLDLYIEFNGTWTHGGHFFDKNDKGDADRLTKWEEKAKTSKFFTNAINTWTVRDILKLETAIKNNLNYIAWFNEEQANDWIDAQKKYFLV